MAHVFGTLEHSPEPERRRVRRTTTPAYRIVGRNLSRPDFVHKPERLVLATGATGPTEPPRHHGGVVLEPQQPAFGFGPAVQPASRLERDERLQIVSHDPWERQMRAGRHQVREEAGALTAALHQHRLMVGDVTRGRQAANPGHHLGFAGYQVEGYPLEIGRQIARRGALVPVTRKLELALLHHVR